MSDEDNRQRDPKPNFERLKNLENDLLAVRNRAEKTAQERSNLEQSLKQAQDQIETLEKREERTQEQIETALAAFNELVENGVVPKRIQRKTIASFAENLASYVVTMDERLTDSNQEIDTLKAENEEQSAQLKVAEDALKNALEQSAALNAQINERIAQFEAQVKELDRQLDEANTTIDALENEKDSETVSNLIEVNREMADEIEQLRTDFSLIQETAQDAKDRLESEKAKMAEAIRKELQPQINNLQQEKTTLESQLSLVNKQLQQDGKTPYLSADRVAGLLNEFVDNMQSNLRGINVSQGEFKLKLAVGGDDDTIGFIVPTPDASAELRENLQEVVLRFDKSSIQPLRSTDPSDK